MKKVWSLAIVMALMLSTQSVSAYAMENTPKDNHSRMSDSKINMNTNRSQTFNSSDYNNNYRSDHGMINSYKSNGVMNDQADRFNATANNNSNNLRATAVDNNDRGMDWSWLGLLGLAGLLGLRSRERERS